MDNTSDWHQLHNRHYRKREWYTMSWDNVDLERLWAVGAPFGGPIAVTRDEKKILAVNTTNLRPNLEIFTSSGAQLASLVWDKGRLIGMGWTENERLICVLEDGSVLMYSIFGELLNQFSLGKECKEQKILDVQIWGTGLVALTHALQLFSIVNFDEPRPRQLADPGLDEAPSSWAAVDPQYTLSLNVEVFLATASGTILVVDGDGVKDQLLSHGPFTKMSVSPSGQMLACFTSTGDLWVCLTDFSKDLYQFPTKSKLAPKQMAWCGNDAVVLYWEKLFLVVTHGDWIKFTYEEPIQLIPEMDGLRIISNSACEFLQRVPNVTEDIFKIGSTAPAAMLFDAMEHYEKKSPKADENLRSIKADLVEAVEACTEAAGHEFVYQSQRGLLRAASLGKCFLTFYAPESFVTMCKNLRVLNAVRHFEIGIPLTLTQYKKLGAAVLIDRLINRHLHLLALRICEFVNLKADKVLVHWACTKVKMAADDQDISGLIIRKLENIPGISYAAIASAAYKFGRPKLATQLLDYEPRAADQVPLLLSMHEDEMALNKAIESGDTDLVYLVILHVKRTRPQQEFMRIVYNKPAAMDLLLHYCKQQDRVLLKDLYLSFELKGDVANLAVTESFQSPDLEGRLKSLQIGMKTFAESKDHQFQAKATEDEIKLLLLQRELEASIPGKKFMNLPLSDTLYQLTIKDESKRANKIRTEFKVPDKRYWWIRIKALAEIRDWDNLEKFSKEKKSPIGYEPFVEVCLEHKAQNEALKYIPRVALASDRADFYIRMGRFTDAADMAFKEKDLQLLERIRQRCTAKDTIPYIEQLMSQFQRK